VYDEPMMLTCALRSLEGIIMRGYSASRRMNGYEGKTITLTVTLTLTLTVTEIEYRIHMKCKI
jgi:hypothetical protein